MPWWNSHGVINQDTPDEEFEVKMIITYNE